MTQRTLSSLIFTIVFSMVTIAVSASGHTEKAASEQSANSAKSNAAAEHNNDAKKMTTAASDAHSKAPHGKSSVPHFEELPHIHKYHKERVKKIRKHHTKIWILSQLIVVLCNISILIIGFLHATH